MARLRREAGLCVGDNEPYSGRDEHGYSIFVHGEDVGVPYGLLEIRQDLIDTAAGQSRLGRPHGRRARRTCWPTTACSRRGGGDMALRDPDFTIGIEEEYLLVDRARRGTSCPMRRPACSRNARSALKSQVMPEFLRSQIEVGTAVCHQSSEARADLARLRADGGGDRRAARPGADRRLHPSLRRLERAEATPTRNATTCWPATCRRTARRLVICGMHVHIGIEDPELRIDLMSQIGYFLPHLLALSTSSPFWSGEDTGLKSYRMAVFDELPRTGLPELFDSWGEFERHLEGADQCRA